MGNNKNAKPNFYFLSDKALEKLEEDRFKHPGIAETLKDIVLNCPLPFTIGLFGRWGTGKSTIAKFLKIKLSGEKDKIAPVDFDVWKHEKDSLRRQFLLTLEKQLKTLEVLDKNYKLDPRVTASTSRGFEGKIKISKEKLGQFCLPIGAILLALSIIGIRIYQVAPEIFPSYLFSFVMSFFTVGTVLVLFQIGSQVITAETETLSYDRFKDPDQFEDEFEKLINDVEIDRVLIIFDNLDRATHKIAVELLSTIKTFLEPKTKKCVFLIQCDEDAIKKHLESVYLKNENVKSKNKTFDADEFLRKFFNTTVKIPPFIDADLEEYTTELLKKTKIEVFDNNPDLVSVITQAFRENPRQIKQFINTLLSHYLMALEREFGSDPIILSGTITGNPAFLAKFLIIRQEWPDFYRAIVDDPKKIDDYSSKDADIKNFMGGTSIIKTDNIRAFIYLKQSARRLRLPGDIGDDLEIALVDNRADDVIKLIKELKTKGVKDNEVTDFIKELIQENKEKQQNLVNIINLTARSRKETGLELQKTFCEEVAKISGSTLLPQLHTLDLDFMFFIIRESRPVRRRPIISHYIDIFGRAKDAEAVKQIPDYPNYALNLATYISNNRELFTSKKKDVRKVLAEAHFDNIDILAVFVKDKLAKKDFITSELLVKLIGSIAEIDLSSPHTTGASLFNKKIEFVLICKKIIDSTVAEAMLEKLASLLATQNKAPETPEKEMAIKQTLEKTELVLKNYSTIIRDKQKADALSDILVQGISKYGEQEKKSWFLPTLLYLNSIISDSKKPAVEQAIKSFTQSATSPVIESFLANKDEEFQQLFFQSTKEDFEVRATKEKDILDLIWELEDETDRDALLVKLLGTPNYTFALDKLEEGNYRVVDPPNIVSLLLDKTTSLAAPEKTPLLNAINKMKCAKNKKLREAYAELLKGMIINQDSTSQQTAFNAYVEARKFLPHLVKLPLTVAIIEWLNSLDPVNINHKFALKTAFLYWDKISSTHKDNLITIVLDRIIAKTSSEEETNMAFDILYSIKPGYTKYKPHFDIAHSRAELEQNAPLKAAIKAGLQKLKPLKAKLKNSYWGKVNKL